MENVYEDGKYFMNSACSFLRFFFFFFLLLFSQSVKCLLKELVCKS